MATLNEELVNPNSYATILRNNSDVRVNVPFLGRHGMSFRPKETVALMGFVPHLPADFKTYNGKSSIVLFHELITQTLPGGTTPVIEVLSIPGGSRETDYEMWDVPGVTLKPNHRIEF